MSLKKLITLTTLSAGLFLSTSANALLLNADADTKVDFSSSTTNFGTGVNLTNNTNGTVLTLSLIRFDLTALVDNALTSALTLFKFNNSAASPLNIYGLNDNETFNSWDELTTTASTVSASGVASTSGVDLSKSSLLGSLSFTQAAKDQPFVFTSALLTSFINNDTDNQLSFILADTSTNSGTAGATLHSKESGTGGQFAPSLDITPAPVPLPAAAWLLLSGLAGLFSFRKKKNSLAA